MSEQSYTFIGDGSGTTKDKPCGYSVNVYDEHGLLLTNIKNGTSNGTNNFAELLPYVNAIWWLHSEIIKNKKTYIKIISDSEVTVKTGNREYNVQGANPNCVLWFGLNDYCEIFNVEITWEWKPRNSDAIMTEMDANAKEERKNMCI